MEIKSVDTSKGERFPVLVKEDEGDKPLLVKLYNQKMLDLIQEKGHTQGLTVLGGFPYDVIRAGRVPEGPYTASELLAKIIEGPRAEELIKKILYMDNQVDGDNIGGIILKNVNITIDPVKDKRNKESLDIGYSVGNKDLIHDNISVSEAKELAEELKDSKEAKPFYEELTKGIKILESAR